jgi:two-component system chemotaxis response regulator CheY
MTKKTIMIVDDSPTLRQAVSMTLQRAGYQVIEGCDGMAALDKMRGQAIDLIISDINMPNMDGISFVRALRQKTQYNTTPVMIFTTQDRAETMREGRQAGAKCWLLKPFQPRHLLGAVNTLFAQ